MTRWLLQILYLRAAKLHFCQETIITFSATVTTNNKNNEKIYSGINYTHKGGPWIVSRSQKAV